MSKQAASARAAALRAQQLQFASGGFGGGGFGSDESLSFMNSNGEQQMIFRKLGKKDATTRRKGLEELKPVVENLSDEDQDSFLKLWSAQFADLIEDPDMRVREYSLRLTEQISKKVGRKLATQLKTIITPWLMARFDPRSDVKQAAVDSFKSAIPEAKHAQSLLFCKNEILETLHEKFQLTVQTIADKKTESQHEQEEKFERVISCAVMALDFFLETIPIEECAKLDQDLLARVLEDRFWALSSAKFPSIRLAVYTLIKTICMRMTDFVEKRAEMFSSIVFGLFGDKEPVAHQALWDAVLAFLQKFPKLFPVQSYKKTLLPKLVTFLTSGCFGSGQSSYSSLLPFLSLLPENDQVLFDSDFINKFLVAVWKGLKSEAIATSGKQKDLGASNPLVEAYMDCIFLLTVKGTKAEGKVQFVQSVLDTHFFPIFDAFFKFENVISPALVPAISTLLERLEARPECIQWSNLFWTRFESYLATYVALNSSASAPDVAENEQKSKQQEVACSHAVDLLACFASSKSHRWMAFVESTLLPSLPHALASPEPFHVKMISSSTCSLFQRIEPSQAIALFQKQVLPVLRSASVLPQVISSAINPMVTQIFISSQSESDIANIWDLLVETWSAQRNASQLRAVIEPLRDSSNKTFSWDLLQRPAVDDMVLNLNLRGGSASDVVFFVSQKGLLKEDTLTALAKICARNLDVVSKKDDDDLPLLLGTASVAVALLGTSSASLLPLASSLIRAHIQRISSNLSDVLASPFRDAARALAAGPVPSSAVDTFVRPLLSYVKDSFESLSGDLSRQITSMAEISGSIISVASRWGCLAEAIGAALFSNQDMTSALVKHLQSAGNLIDSLALGHVYVELPNTRALAASSSSSSSGFKHMLQFQLEIMQHAGFGLFSRAHLLPNVYCVLEAALVLQRHDEITFQSLVQKTIGSCEDATVAESALDSIVAYARDQAGTVLASLATVVANFVFKRVFEALSDDDSKAKLAVDQLKKHFGGRQLDLPSGLAFSILPILISKVAESSPIVLDLRRRVMDQLYLSPNTALVAENEAKLAVALESSLIVFSGANFDDSEQRKLLENFIPLARSILASVDRVGGPLACYLIRFTDLIILDRFDMKITPSHWAASLDVCRSFVHRELSKLKSGTPDVCVLNAAIMLLRSICTMESSKFEWNRLSVEVFPDLFDLFTASTPISAATNRVACAATVFLEEDAKTTSSWQTSPTFARNLASVIRLIPLPLLKTLPVAELYKTIVSEHVEAQFASYSLLKSRAQDILSKLTTDSSSSSARPLACSVEKVEEEEIDTSVLDPELKQLLEDANLYVTTEAKSAHSAFHAKLGLLLTWSILLEHLDPSVTKDAKVRSDLGTYVRRLGLLDFILSLVFEHLQQAEQSVDETLRDLEASKIEQLWNAMRDLDEDDDAEIRLLASVSAFLFRRVVEALPALVRSWWNSLGNRLLRSQVEKFTTRFVSPLIIPRELTRAAAWKDDSCDYFTIRASNVTSEVTATYKKDEAELTIVLRIPAAYPLNSIAVEMAQRMGVAEALWRKWLLSMTTLLLTRDGTVLDAVLLWKQFLDKHFEGVDVCPICYSIFHISNHALPNLACKTCRNKFHSACLYKWFNTSRKNECPLCKSAFN